MHDHHDRHHDDSHDHHEHGHDHTHGLVDESILRSKEGVQAVSQSLVVLLATAVIQTFVYASATSVSLFADIVHNFGDSLTALPLGAAFLLKSRRAERAAGYVVVATIFLSACLTAWQAIVRLMHPADLGEHVFILVLAGIVGFAGNEIAASIRLNAGKHLHSAALIADGNHARVDGLVSLSVVAAAVLGGLGYHTADPIIGLAMTFVIFRITWHSFVAIRDSE